MAEKQFQRMPGRRGGTDARGLCNVGYQYLVVGYDDSEIMRFTPPDFPVDVPIDTRTYDAVEQMGSDWCYVWFNALGIAGTEDEPPNGKTQYRKRARWRQVPIEAFPDRAMLVSDFGAFDDGDGRLKFPRKLPSGGLTEPGVFAVTGSGAGASEDNPLYGVTFYTVQVLCAIKSYIRRTEPAGLFARSGDVIENLPDDFPNSTEGGPWLVNCPESTTRGNCCEIIETFDEIDQLQHIQALQKLIQRGRNRG